ncbi:MAG: flavodoxin [Syntrophomonadaceae bacterium]|nr:flavodoxin [Syntrophomonadaceae bacterium]
MKKALVAYFSISGVTAGKAELITKIVGADTYEISPKIPYQAKDLDWENETSRSTLEMKDLDCRPEIAMPVCDMEQYETVFVGFPIWWFREPSIIDTFMESYDFSGKTIIPFATSIESPIGDTEKRLREICKGTPDWAEAKMLTGFDETKIREWVESLSL